MMLESRDLLYIMTTIISYQKGEVPLYIYNALLKSSCAEESRLNFENGNPARMFDWFLPLEVSNSSINATMHDTILPEKVS